MSLISQKIRELLSLPDDAHLMRSQMTALTRQLPLLYVILATNSIALAFTHYSIAPNYLTLYIPAVMLPVCVQRTVTWMRMQVTSMSDEAIRQRLRSTIVLTSILGAVFTAWSLSLCSYGDGYARSHVAYFMSITVIGCIFCLMHLRPAALLLTAIVTVPFTIRFFLAGNLVLGAIALNFCLVAIIMVVILFASYRAFKELVESQQHLEALSRQNFENANLDSLTGLANRRRFFNDLEGMTTGHALTDGGFTLGLIDLDRFKPINDIYGHAAGDMVLIEVGRRLKEVLGPSVLLARLGGDEFGFVLPLTMDVAAIGAVGRSICEALQAPMVLSTGIAQMAASIGFAAFPDMAPNRQQLLERADYALYPAKENNRGTAVIFDTQHEKAIRARGRIEQELRGADFERELSLQFQPIFDVVSGRTVAFEALARWNSPALGRVSPAEFIIAAEQLGIISEITQVLLRKACEVASHWPRSVGLSFNLSVHDLASSVAIAKIIDIIQASGVDPGRIALEITETAVMRDFGQARDMLMTLKAIGVDIALDDFGTGFSSLSYVHRLPLDKIKVDQSFMAGLTTDKASRDIVKTIVALCRNLGLVCIIEGVELADQVLVLQTLGCTTMQGYYFAKPLNAADLGPFLADPRAAASDDEDDRPDVRRMVRIA